MSVNAQDLEQLKIDHLVDAVGEVCPHTLNMALAGLKKAKPGEIVVEVTDHTIATKTIPAAVKMNKYAEFLGIVNKNGKHHIYLKKI